MYVCGCCRAYTCGYRCLSCLSNGLCCCCVSLTLTTVECTVNNRLWNEKIHTVKASVQRSYCSMTVGPVCVWHSDGAPFSMIKRIWKQLHSMDECMCECVCVCTLTIVQLDGMARPIPSRCRSFSLAFAVVYVCILLCLLAHIVCTAYICTSARVWHEAYR